MKSSWLIDRTIASLSVRVASIGKCSLIRTPGVLVAIVPKLPRISAGASGLGSQVSSWLGPPHMKISMHDFARPNPSGPAVAARLRYSSGNPSPAIARAPAASPTVAKSRGLAGTRGNPAADPSPVHPSWRPRCSTID